jgi:hypothetical protein
MREQSATCFDTPTLSQKLALIPGWTVDIVIQAPVQPVWDIVSDFDAYRHWNPFVLKASAEFRVGGKIHFLEDLERFGQHWLNAKFLSIDAPNSFVWQGYFGASFLFAVRHSFIFEAINEHETHFTQVHENSGLLIPYLALRGVYYVSRQGYINYNQALKERCESPRSR